MMTIMTMIVAIRYGADGVCPYMAYEAIAKMNSEGLVEAMANQQYADAELFKEYRKSVAKGILKVMSKMGISTLQSYKGAQVFHYYVVDDDDDDIFSSHDSSWSREQVVE